MGEPFILRDFEVEEAEEEENREIIVYSAGEAFDPLPPVEYVVNILIQKYSTNILYGDPGLQKTYIVMTMGAAITLGDDWAGIGVQEGKVLFIDEESGEHRFKRRLREVFNGYGYTKKPANSDNFHFVTGTGINLLKPSGIGTLKQLIRRHKPDLVILDALQDVMEGGDENSSGDITRVFNALNRISKSLKTAFLVIHHTNRKGTFRGSSAIMGSVDGMYELDGNAKSGNLVIRMDKNRDGEVEEIPLKTEFGYGISGERYFKVSSRSISKPEHNDMESYLLGLYSTGRVLTLKEIEEMTIADGKSFGSAKKANQRLQRAGIVSRIDGGGKGSKAQFQLTQAVK